MTDVSGEDPRISDFLDNVERDLIYIEVIGETFVDQDVYLDGRYWDKCTFRRCRIISRAGLFRMGNCTFAEHKGIALHGPAARLFELLTASRNMGGDVDIVIDGYRGPKGPTN
jgi:hypothetical protein